MTAAWRPGSSVTHGAPVVFVVNDDISVRESLDLLIRRGGWHPRLSACATEFLSRPRLMVPSCLILDVMLPDVNGLEVQQLVADRAEMPVIFVTGHSDIPTTVRAMKAGAAEFLTKPFEDEQLLNAIRCALEQSRAALSQELQRRTLQERYALLSGREREVMDLVVSGWLNKQIAAELQITTFTVKAHRGRVMRKLGAASVADLIRMADRLRLRTTARARIQSATDAAPLRSPIFGTA